MALQRAHRQLERAVRRARGARPLARARRRDGVDEAVRAPADGRRLRAAAAQGARGHADDPAPRLRKGVRGAGEVERHAAPPSGEATFAVPKDAYVGSYQILVRDTLAPHAKEAQERLAGTFRVEAFRVPLMRARLQAVGTPLVRPTDVGIDVQVSYLSGGGAGGLPVTLRSQVERQARQLPGLRRLRVRRRQREGRPRGAGRRRRALRRLHVRRPGRGRAGRGRRAAPRSAAPRCRSRSTRPAARARRSATSRRRTSRTTCWPSSSTATRTARR